MRAIKPPTPRKAAMAIVTFCGRSALRSPGNIIQAPAAATCAIWNQLVANLADCFQFHMRRMVSPCGSGRGHDGTVARACAPRPHRPRLPGRYRRRPHQNRYLYASLLLEGEGNPRRLRPYSSAFLLFGNLCVYFLSKLWCPLKDHRKLVVSYIESAFLVDLVSARN